MNQIFSFKSAITLGVATLAMCFATQDANAQCRSGGRGFSPGFGGTGLSFSYSSGFRGTGFNNFGPSFGGFGPGVSVNINRGIYGSPYLRNSSFYRSSFYGNPYRGGYVPVNRNPYRYGHGFRW